MAGCGNSFVLWNVELTVCFHSFYLNFSGFHRGYLRKCAFILPPFFLNCDGKFLRRLEVEHVKYKLWLSLVTPNFSISLFFLHSDGNQQKCFKIQKGFNHPSPHPLEPSGAEPVPLTLSPASIVYWAVWRISGWWSSHNSLQAMLIRNMMLWFMGLKGPSKVLV